jgi:hypothetical protein
MKHGAGDLRLVAGSSLCRLLLLLGMATIWACCINGGVGHFGVSFPDDRDMEPLCTP